MFPSRKVFIQKVKPGDYAPFIVRLNIDARPRDVYHALCRGKVFPSLLLESGRRLPGTGEYSYVLPEPFMRFVSKGRRQLLRPVRGKSRSFRGSPFVSLRKVFRPFRVSRFEGLPPFTGGAAGLLSYELKNQIERSRPPETDPYGIADMDLGFFDRGVVFDHRQDAVFAFCLYRAGSDVRKAYADGSEACTAFASTLSRRYPKARPSESVRDLDFEPKIRTHAGAFQKSVVRVKEHIRRGDIFQANLSHCLRLRRPKDPFEAYLRQCEMNPTCFSAYADFGDIQIVCGSPERLVLLRDGEVSTRPIAGTRPRAKERLRDRRLSSELLLSPKERAEHVMLIDLERNDIGRVCRFGSVRVDELMRIEEYSHVRHIVSNIRGRLRGDRDAFDLLQAVFPGGTITGAPKVRSMEIIDAMERRARGPYTGSLGYFAFNGNCDFNIIIRSLLVTAERAYLQVGAGIVADSDPEHEYIETLHKAQAFLEVLRRPQRRALRPASA